MECSEITERLWQYLDGELAAKEAAAVDGHLDGCSCAVATSAVTARF